MVQNIPSSVIHATRIFRRLFFWSCVIGTMVCGLSIDGLRAEEAPIPAGPLFHEATKQFKEMKTTLYQHHTEVDLATGTYRYDCVGFISYALKQAAPQARESAFNALEIQPGRIPSPSKYRAFFASLAEKPQTGWQAVTKVSELRPGDVVVWEKKTKTATGHAVVIGGVPVKSPEGTWVVMVYDSTAFPHGEDSRPDDQRAQVLDSNGNHCGLGHGMMAFTADPLTGVLTGYCWSPKSKPNTVPISAGRPTS